MKYAVTVVFFLFFFTLLAYSHPCVNSGTANNLNKVYFTDVLSGFPVGKSYIILPAMLIENNKILTAYFSGGKEK